MGDKDQKVTQDEQADVEGHKHYLNEQDAIEEKDETPDVEGHKHIKSPVRKHIKKHY